LDDAIELLFKASNRSETDQIEKRCDAEAVVKLLAQHALAVVQAGAYIERSPCTFKEYKEEFQEQRKSLLSYEKTQDSTRYGGVYATFEVSAKLLKNPKKPNQSYANALELLGILGHLYFTGVPEDMFTRAWKYAQNIKKHPPHDDDIESLSAWHVSKLPKSLQESPPKNGTQKPPESLRKALAVLRSFAIITIQPETKDISMHPLIHAWAQDRLPKHDRHDAWASTMSLVALSLEFDFEYQSFWRRLQPHVETCIDASPKGVFNIYPTIDIGRVLYQFAWLFYRVNKYSQCKELTAKLRKKFCREGSGVMNSSSIEYLHAICLQSLAEFHAAKDILEGIVKINKGSITATKNSGGVESDKGLITVIKNSGGVKSDQGHTTATKISGGMKNENGLTTAAKISDGVKSGEGGLTTTVEISRGVVENGKGSTPATSKIQSSAKIALADIYLTEGSGRLVINIIDNIIDEVLHTREPPQQANALSVAKTLLIALNELVYMLLGDGSNKGAIAVLVAVIHIQNSANNTTHHDRPAPQHRFAIKLSAGTNNKKAIELLRELVHIQGMSGIQGVLLEPGNPTRLATQHELAVVLCTGREYKEAISIIQDVIWRRTSTLDPTHTNLLASKYLLASIYSQMGKHKEALETIRGVIYIAERIWDPSDERRRDCELLREHCEARTKGMLNALKQRIIELSSWNEKKNEGDKGGG
jgi:tetratricopeptide (TPR) repeat protein